MEHFTDDEEPDRQLRDAIPYIDDGGFTVRVLQQLPARPASMRLRGVILITVTLLASVLAYVLSGGGRFLNEFVVRVSELPILWLLIITLIAGMAVAAFGVVA